MKCLYRNAKYIPPTKLFIIYKSNVAKESIS